jgi:DNA topoisomerase IA
VTVYAAVAQDIARVLAPLSGSGSFTKHTSGSYFISSDQRTAVTWSFGHLVDWTDEKNLAASWKADALPILPEQFTLVPTAVRMFYLTLGLRQGS